MELLVIQLTDFELFICQREISKKYLEDKYRICTKMNVVFSDQNVGYTIIEIAFLALIVIVALIIIGVMLLLLKKIKTEKREAVYRMIIYTVNLLSLGEMLYHTGMRRIFQIVGDKQFLKYFVVFYIVFCLLMYRIQVVKMLNTLKINRLIDREDGFFAGG